MKVIKDNYTRYPRIAVCDNCRSEIKLEDFDDIEEVNECTGEYIEHVWRCPLCGEKNSVYFNYI